MLAEDDGTLGITAQGRFTDVRERPVRLKRGVARVLFELPRVEAVPIALEYPFWNEPKPEALVRFGRPLRPRARSVDAVNSVLERALEAELDALADAALSRDASRFELLVAGRGRGVGVWQDLPQVLRVWARGRRFDPSHGAVGRGAP